MTIRTISETLFERFCTDTGIHFTRLLPAPSVGRRTPDYEIYLQEPPILVEVKQIDPNRKDQALFRLFAKTGEYRFSGVPGDRLRGRISKAGQQLPARVRPDQPTMVVVYNNVDVLRGFTGPHAVMAAMYGLYKAVITRSHMCLLKAVQAAASANAQSRDPEVTRGFGFAEPGPTAQNRLK